MKKKKKSKLKAAQDEAQDAVNKTNKKIEELGEHSNDLCMALNNIQELFDEIRNIPNDKKLECEKLKKIRLKWKQQAEKIESDYKTAAVKNAGAGAAGVGAGVAVVALGPTAAMGIATTFGVASTGTAISTLSGAECCFSMAWWRSTCSRWRRHGRRQCISCTCWTCRLGNCRGCTYCKWLYVLEINK